MQYQPTAATIQLSLMKVQWNILKTISIIILLTTLLLFLPSEDIWLDPVKGGIVTSECGSRINPITGKKESHKGIDIGVAENTEVAAVKSGQITKSGYSDSYGNYIGYKTYDGYDILYAHLKSVDAKVGDVVSQGQIIAHSGNTGQSTGPHLHYEIEYNSKEINPHKYINK